MKAAEIEEEATAAADAVDENQPADLTPPDWLNVQGRAVWEQLAPKLKAMRILTKLDELSFGRYCQGFGTWLELQKIMDEKGTFYESESPHGTYQRSHPAFMQADRLDRKLVTMEGNFGLNPADRQRLFAARADAERNPDLFNPPGQDASSDRKGKAQSPIGLLN
ncbi:phage terminase small subunit P27 family [uncultured Roseobacter sp.]|uniref:phage terminase small subunit P27 family n=1 Tax=uncultured Roseobacter sp. TaxID=114847 RepID=UPI0026300E8E|nr:phage terminase small subunit P27 family [uncultured Roseobacter sp.]